MKSRVLLFVGALLLVSANGCSRNPPVPALAGTVMTKEIEAIDFSLEDQKGETYRLSGSRGKVVVLSFLFTHCDDTCPFMTIKIKDVREQLGSLVDKVDFVAVTTDPERDDREAIAAYSRAAGLFDGWHFLTGPAAAVKKVWSDYGIGVHRNEDVEEGETGQADHSGSMGMGAMAESASKGLSPASKELAKALAVKFGSGYEVSHTAPFWIIDPKGRLRAVLNADAPPSDILLDIKALLPR